MEGAVNEVTEVALSTVFMSEAFGTAVLVLLGCGVVANVVLPWCAGAPRWPCLLYTSDAADE